MRRTLPLLGTLALLLTVTLVASEPAKPPKRRITVEEIQNSVVIGRLGVPLGDVVTVKMRWSPVSSKPSDIAIVSDVGGRALDRPARFWHDMPRTPHKKSGVSETRFERERDYEFRAYETGGFFGTRDEWLKEMGQQSVQSFGYAFLPELRLLREAPANHSKPRSQPDWREAKRRITVDEIQNAVIIGKLGVPLGEVVTIRIRWESDGGGKILDRLIVSELDGAQLDPPVVFEDEMPSSEDNRTGRRVDKFLFDRDYLVRAYETAGFKGLVHDPLKTVDGSENLIQGRGFWFRSQMVFLRDASADSQNGRSPQLIQQR